MFGTFPIRINLTKSMKTRRLILSLGLALAGFAGLQAQTHKCATHDIWETKALRDPSMIERKQQSDLAIQNWISSHPQADETAAVITIPVVVHVVYKNQTENISDAQIYSQIDVLNQDFRLLNPDSLDNTHPFWSVTADAEIEFCLASIDPNGNATTGITRTSTTHNTFQNLNIDDIKFTSAGGKDNWDPTQYLNLWVCDLGNQLYGYATFPSDLAVDPNYDGVVINYNSFGTVGAVVAPGDQGRTGSHEIGHWLDLSHIWGDQICGDDLVADTEPAEDANYGCFTFPFNANNNCGSGVNGEMYMNYMDYTDDACMAMFTAGQKARMRAALNGDRSALLSSAGCSGATGVRDLAGNPTISLYPNPSNGMVTVETRNFTPRQATISVTNALGVEVMRYDAVHAFPYSMDLSKLPSDLYFVRLAAGNQLLTQKVVVTH